jgi:hypothetical protein
MFPDITNVMPLERPFNNNLYYQKKPLNNKAATSIDQVATNPLIAPINYTSAGKLPEERGVQPSPISLDTTDKYSSIE